jgi:predicted ester cyclase
MADPRDVARRHDDAYNAKDVEGRKQCVSPDVEMEFPGGMHFRGLDEVQQIESVFWTAIPDGKIKRTAEFVDGETAIAEGVVTGTHTGPFRTPQAEIAPSGNPVELRFVSVKRVVDDKIVSEHLYFDQMELMMQLGAIPGPSPA